MGSGVIAAKGGVGDFGEANMSPGTTRRDLTPQLVMTGLVLSTLRARIPILGSPMPLARFDWENAAPRPVRLAAERNIVALQ